MPRPRFSRLSALVAGSLAALPVATGASAQNILENPGFESGVSPWYQLGDGSVTRTDGASAEGSWAGYSLREPTGPVWSGPAQRLDVNRLTSGETYLMRARVYLLAPTTRDCKLTLRLKLVGSPDFLFFSGASRPAADLTPFEWVQLEGYVTPSWSGTLDKAVLYAEGPDAGVDFLIDEVVLEPLPRSSDWRAEAAAGIEAHRTSDLTVTVVDASGDPVPGATVTVEQTARSFPFGTAVSVPELSIPEYASFITGHFNWITPENAAKWPVVQPTPSPANYWQPDQIDAFAQQQGLTVYGHNIFWAVERRVPDWVKALGDAALESAMETRADELLGRYAGRWPAWDVNNEMLHGSFFADRLGEPIRAWMFQRARQADPAARLYVNDYAILTGTRGVEYLDQIAGLLAAGAPIDGVGVQGHFFSPVDPDLVRNRLDLIAEAGLPVRVTEFDVGTLDDAQRADWVEKFFRVAFSHPAVEGISIWGFWENRHWRGAESALVDADWTVNAAGQMLIDLLEEWRTEETLAADGAGVATLRAFHGTHTVTATSGASEAVATVEVMPGEAASVVLALGSPGCSGADVAEPFGVIDAGDVSAFLGALTAGEAWADVSGDGVIDFYDAAAFLGLVAAGCP